MKKPDGVAGRLAEIAPVELDGELWWEAEKVYRAFKVDPRAAARKIRREYKRRLYVFHRGYKSRLSGTSAVPGSRHWQCFTASSHAPWSWRPCAGREHAHGNAALPRCEASV